MRFLDFARLNLVKDQKHSAKAQGREYVLDIFSGRATVTVETADGQKQVFSNVGARADVFSGPPVMVSPERNGATALGLTTRDTLG